MMRHYLYVATGSALGGLARYGTIAAAIAAFGPSFPVGTFIANVLGSAIIGVIAALTRSEGRYLISPEARSLLAIGFCGGFTTFSFFAWQTMVLAGVDWSAALAYVGLSCTLPLAAVWGAYAVTLRISTRRK